MTLAGRTFRAIANSANGTITSDTTMSFTEEDQDGTILGVYSGGNIRHGSVVAIRRTSTGLEMLYHCVTTSGELRAGHALGVIAEDPTDRIERLYLDWQWLTGERSRGSSEWVLETAGGHAQ
jgi:hypothetical protein